MGNNQPKQTQKPRIRKRDSIKLIYKWMKNSQKGINQFSKLGTCNSIIVSYLTTQELGNLLSVSRSMFQIFSKESAPYQIECCRLLNLQLELIPSTKWKILLQNLYCSSLNSIPFSEAFKNVGKKILIKPLLVEYATELSHFQKSILYYDNLRIEHSNLSELILLADAKNFTLQNIDIVLRLRLGDELNIQLPSLLMIIYNMQELIKIYLIYINIRLEDCTIEEYLKLWQHYTAWIGTLEQASNPYIQSYNKLLIDIFPQYILPKYSVRWFMVSQWLRQLPEALKLKLKHHFSVLLNQSRQIYQKSTILKNYVQHYIDLNCNQSNIHKYGHLSFEYSDDVEALIKIAKNQSQQLYSQDNFDFIKDEQILKYIFGQLLFETKLFEFIFQARIEQLKKKLKIHISESIAQRVSITTEQQEINQEQQPVPHLFLQQFYYDPTKMMKALFRAVQEENDETNTQQQQQQQQSQSSQCKFDSQRGSLDSSSISQTSTNLSGVFSSFRFKGGNDQLFNFVKQNKNELFKEIRDLFIKQHEILENNRNLNFRIENNIGFSKQLDLPRLCEYERGYELMQLQQEFQQKKQRSEVILQGFQQEEWQTVLTSNIQSLAQSIMQQDSWFKG